MTPDDRALIPFEIQPQPDDETCGPTCLHAVYRHFGETISLEETIATVARLDHHDAGRGTIASMLGCHALDRGYRARLWSYNLRVFDPSWFPAERDAAADPALLAAKLKAQAEFKGPADPKLAVVCDWYRAFIERGGEIRLRDPSSRFLVGLLSAGIPLLAGLSATWLYRCRREFGPTDEYDDVRGEPAGHFVVLCGYDPRGRRVHVADPLESNPGFASRRYDVPLSRIVPALLLGVLTWDANVLAIEPPARSGSPTE